MIPDSALLPNDTQEIFEELRLGHFLTRNHPSSSQRKLYSICANSYEVLHAYFAPLGYDLNRGEGYFYFSKKLQKQQIDSKVARILEMIDLVDLFMSYDNNFGVGWQGTPSALKENADDNIVIRERLDRIKGIKGETLQLKCKSAFLRLEENGYMAMVDEERELYMVLDSYRYIRKFLDSVRELQIESA